MRHLIFIAAVMAMNTLCLAGTLYVPKDYPTIQQAIDAAADEDKILVAPGTYVERINFLGKDTQVRSDADGDPGTYDLVPDLTIIDGSQAGSVVTFEGGEISSTSLSGFTITNGNGYKTTIAEGGGITCAGDSAPDISRNIIMDNSSHLYGGGISCSGYSHPTIYDNEIVNNSAANGGGVSCIGNSYPVVNYNRIKENQALYKGGKSGTGGGVYCDAYGYNFMSVTIINNEMTKNKSDVTGGGISAYYYAEIRGNTITENTSHYGGGIYCQGYDPLIERNFIGGNLANGSGGGIHILAGFPKVHSNLIYGNVSVYVGGGLYCHSDTPVPSEFNNNTFAGNTAQKGGGIACEYQTTLHVRNTILWGNNASEGKEIWLDGLPLNLYLSFCDLEGGVSSIHHTPGCLVHWGPGMINADPLFEDFYKDDYHLTRRSPCINMGSNEYAPEYDIDFDHLPFMGTADMGADEFAGLHPLSADVFFLHDTTGGVIQFELDGGPQNAGRDYLILGSLSGKVPGTVLPGGAGTVPLNWDYFTDIVVMFSIPGSVVFTDFYGTLDSSGLMKAVFDTNGPLPGLLGLTFSFAYVLQGPPWDFASNPIDVEVVL